jgi:hypothetical protein
MVTPNRVMCDVSLCFHPARDVTAAAVEPALQATCDYSPQRHCEGGEGGRGTCTRYAKLTLLRSCTVAGALKRTFQNIVRHVILVVDLG